MGTEIPSNRTSPYHHNLFHPRRISFYLHECLSQGGQYTQRKTCALSLQRLQVKINKLSGDTDKKEKTSSFANSVTVQGEEDGHHSTTIYGTHSS
jgi:hypothetical protein